jgi:hypothetical protein
MQSIPYDINYEQINIGSIFDEIDRICRESILVRSIRLIIFRYDLKRMVKSTLKMNNVLIQNLYELDFSKLKEIEALNISMLKTLDGMPERCNNCPDIKCRRVFFNNFYKPLLASTQETLKAITKSYHFDAGLFFANDEELKENNEALEELADVWDYESTVEDEEFIFKHNVEMHGIK